jgi:hypothetical protein
MLASVLALGAAIWMVNYVMRQDEEPVSPKRPAVNAAVQSSAPRLAQSEGRRR